MKLSKQQTRYYNDREEPKYNTLYQTGSTALQQNQLQEYARLHPFDKNQALLNRQNYYHQNTNPQYKNFNIAPNDMVKRAKIDGDPYTINEYSYQLTPEALKQAGLEPCHEFTMEGMKIGISHIFKACGYKTAIGYIEDPRGKVHARSYYQSKSSGQWRYLPDYVANENGYPTWFGKGYGEESLTLPSKLQKELNFVNEQGVVNTNNIDPNYLFFGTAKKYRSQLEHAQLKHRKMLKGDFYQEVNNTPEYDFGKLSSDKRPPEYIDVRGSSEPNFRMPPEQYETYSQLYGKVNVEMFPSFDQNLLYSMCKVGTPPQGWIGNIETTSRITTTGCRKEWVSMGDLGTPLFEYKEQADGYGENRNFNSSYVSMWNNYLRKTPIIRRWLQIFD